MIDIFFTTVMIITGILLPPAIIAAILFIIAWFAYWQEGITYDKQQEMEDAKKMPPYDNIELSQPPNPTMFTIRLIKNNKTVWKASYDKELFNKIKHGLGEIK